MTATELVQAYYAAFNAGDMPAFLDLLAEDVVHDINQGERQIGKATFAAFMDKMNRCYRERLAAPDTESAWLRWPCLSRQLGVDLQLTA